MKRIVMALMVLGGPLVLAGSDAHQLLCGSASSENLPDGFSEDEDGVRISGKDAPEHDVRLAEVLSSSPAQAFTQGIKKVVNGLFGTPPLVLDDKEDDKAAYEMCFAVLKNSGEGVGALLKKIGPVCAERRAMNSKADDFAAIHLAASLPDRLERLQQLIDADVSLEVLTRTGKSPLQLALFDANKAVTEKLVSAGAQFGEEEIGILETLPANEESIRALTELLGRAQQDRLVTQVLATRLQLEKGKKRQEEARRALEKTTLREQEAAERVRCELEKAALRAPHNEAEDNQQAEEGEDGSGNEDTDHEAGAEEE